MAKKSQIIFMDGKEIALNSLFTGDNCPFGYLAIGYAPEDNGFEEPVVSSQGVNGFQELEETNGYQRIPLEPLTGEQPEKDTDSGKVLVKFSATLSTDNIKQSQQINQIAVVDSKSTIRGADTKYYSATTFPTFIKTQESSITFVVGFRL